MSCMTGLAKGQPEDDLSHQSGDDLTVLAKGHAGDDLLDQLEDDLLHMDILVMTQQTILNDVPFSLFIYIFILVLNILVGVFEAH